jgi:hypothetical protein
MVRSSWTPPACRYLLKKIWTRRAHGSVPNEQKKTSKTFNSGYSLVVTHLTTNPPVRCLNRAERTGSLVISYSTTNVFHHRAGHTTEPATFPWHDQLSPYQIMPQQHNAITIQEEGRLNLTLQAYTTSQFKSLRRAVVAFNIIH